MYIYKCILYICRLFMYTFVVHIQFFRLAYRALSIPTGNIAIFLNLQQFVYKNVIAHPNGTREDLWIFIKIWKQEWLILGALNNEASKNRSHQNYCFLLLFFSGATVYQVVQPQQMFKKKTFEDLGSTNPSTWNLAKWWKICWWWLGCFVSGHQKLNGTLPTDPKGSCDWAIRCAGLGVRETWVLLEISWILAIISHHWKKDLLLKVDRNLSIRWQEVGLWLAHCRSNDTTLSTPKAQNFL